jgi:hypothetical protein
MHHIRYGKPRNTTVLATVFQTPAAADGEYPIGQLLLSDISIIGHYKNSGDSGQARAQNT